MVQFGKKGRYYSAVARVTSIYRDPNKINHFYAKLSDFLDFDQPVACSFNGGFEPNFVLPSGEINPGYRVQAVRIIDTDVFTAVCSAGLTEKEHWPDRRDDIDLDGQANEGTFSGFGDQPQAKFEELSAYEENLPLERITISHLTNRRFRDIRFRKHIRELYDRRCALIGLRLINGKGRPEVEAAHIRPISDGGSDSVQNGIALSGTVHWMFDRGLLSLSNSFDILKSRYLNYDVTHILNKDMKAIVPSEPSLQPHSEYLAWHRERIFKQ
ncbi:HNH endonuclease [Roseibium sp. CAU 1637]|uniref:HNH endonuclease n=1 Tax=Roseibium limicola TaxID=2816037 RepID=A0A939EJX7_9HYPH|nr:HNH endonuclease [Roseibium limicola]MBO0343797.1 HNH endonuclease [Roseibium limicola]